MKILFLALILCACGKVEMKSLVPAERERGISPLVEYNRYDPNIDIMVAFLWPEGIKTPKQKKLVRDIIVLSRKLKSSKDDYFAKKIEIQKRFKLERCQCTLNGLCEEGETPGSEEVCMSIENEGYVNDGKLLGIMEMVEVVKSSVHECGGEWLDTQSDLPEAGTSVFDFETMTLMFSALGSANGEAIPYEIKNLKPKNLENYTELKFDLPRVGGGLFRFELGMKANKYSLTVQGDLFWKTRRGIIYWEHATLQ